MSMSSIDWLSPMRSSMSWPTEPYATPAMSIPAVQPKTLPRWSRQPSPTGVVSAADAVAGPGRGGTSPPPTSRTPSSA